MSAAPTRNNSSAWPVMCNRTCLIQLVALAWAGLYMLIFYGCEARKPSASCPASYLQVDSLGYSVFFVACRAELNSMPHSQKEEIEREIIENIQKRRIQPISLDGLDSTLCINRDGHLQVLDEKSGFSCVLVQGRMASAILFGSRNYLQSLSAEDVSRVATTMDGIVGEEGLRLLNRARSPAFRASVVASLNSSIGRPVFDDLALTRYSISEPIP